MKKRLSYNTQSLIKGVGQGVTQDALAREGQRISFQKRPVDLEQRFHPFTGNGLIIDLQKREPQPRWDRRSSVTLDYIRLWFPNQNNKSKWQNFESFLRGLTIVKNPINFLIIGNRGAIIHCLGVDPDDTLLVKNALKSRFPDMECESEVDPFSKFERAIRLISDEGYDWDLRDYYIGPAYWRTLTVNENIESSPLLSIYSTISSLQENEIGFYQVILKPVTCPWSKNIAKLIDAESEAIKYGNINFSDEWYYAGFGNRENKNKVKAPILAVAVREGAFCRKAKIEGVMNSLSLAITNFQFAGEKLNYFSKVDYRGVITSGIELLKIVAFGIAYHSGNLLNTVETSGFFHFPAGEILKNKEYKIDRIKGFRVPDELKGEGIIIGYSDYAGERSTVRQPERIRKNHTAILGLIDKGKSVEIENMVLDDIHKGHGVGLIDPHGVLAERVIRQIPKEYVDKTVFFTLSDDKYVPCYNPFKTGSDVNKTVDDNINRFKGLYPANAWGHTIEDVLRHSFYAIAVTPGLSLSDIRILLSKNSKGRKLRQYMFSYLNNKEEELFWSEDFGRISMQRVTSKLTLFLQPKDSKRVFSQKKNKIDFREIIDKRKIFLADLRAGVLGSDLTNIVGSCLFSSFYDAGMSRMDMVDDEALDSEIGVPFNLYVDEFHRYPTKSFEHSLRQLRKFNLRLILAFQQKEYMNEAIKSALSNIGTWIVLALGWDDAQRIFKEFYGEIEINDFMRRTTGDAYAKIAETIVNMKTFPPAKIEDKGVKEEIIQHSRKRYYTRIKNTGAAVTGNTQNVKKRNRKVIYDEI